MQNETNFNKIETLKTYQSKTINESITKLMQQLSKKFNNKVSLIKTIWHDISPDWGKELIPYTIKNKTLFFKTKKNSLILQYREQEILRIVKLIVGEEIDSIRILNN